MINDNMEEDIISNKLKIDTEIDESTKIKILVQRADGISATFQDNQHR